MSPSEILNRAADLIRDAGEGASPGPWRFSWPAEGGEIAQPVEHGGRRAFLVDMDQGCDMATLHWVCLMSPAVAPALEALVRVAAIEEANPSPLPYGSASLNSLMVAARELARQVLGEDSHEAR